MKRVEPFYIQERPAFVEFVDYDYNNLDITDGYALYLDFKTNTSIINFKKEEKNMNEEIKYNILSDDGNNISYEKAIVSKHEISRDRILACRERIEAINANIEEEKKEISMLEEEISELENVVAIADEKKAQENQVVNEEIVAENVDNANYQG